MVSHDKNAPKHAMVRNYYDTHVQALERSYTDTRWHANLTGEFDYRQTLRTLKQALGVQKFKNTIEIGPGDGVWTGVIRDHTNGSLYLIEQSEAMLAQAREKYAHDPQISFERADFFESKAPQDVDLVVAIRSFEYFSDKAAALKKMYALLRPGGTLLIITKNAQFITSRNVQEQSIHGGQVSSKQMRTLLRNAQFKVVSWYPATLRWKIRYALARYIFEALHRGAIASRGRFWLPGLFTYATESYCYIAQRPLL